MGINLARLEMNKDPERRNAFFDAVASLVAPTGYADFFDDLMSFISNPDYITIFALSKKYQVTRASLLRSITSFHTAFTFYRVGSDERMKEFLRLACRDVMPEPLEE